MSIPTFLHWKKDVSKTRKNMRIVNIKVKTLKKILRRSHAQMMIAEKVECFC